LKGFETQRKMKGIWLANGELTYRDDLPFPRIGQGDALVRVLQAGICATDLELVKGYYPFSGIPGHEFVGVVEAGPDHLIGKRVVSELTIACGHCTECTRNKENHCLKRQVLGIYDRPGAFAEWIAIPPECLHIVPENIGTDLATFAEPLAAALQIQEQVHLDDNLKILILGVGKLGFLIAETLKNRQGNLTLAVRTHQSVERLNALGYHCMMSDQLAQNHYDVVVEVTGTKEGFPIAINAVRPTGTIVLKSTFAEHITADLSPLVVQEIKVIGSRCGPFDKSLALMATGEIEPEHLIGSKYPLKQAISGFTEAASCKGGKVIIQMD
jgi:2-desacetyl-2-hydroxyethyl bacteriochlorophyllide A dehydrogenase